MTSSLFHNDCSKRDLGSVESGPRWPTLGVVFLAAVLLVQGGFACRAWAQAPPAPAPADPATPGQQPSTVEPGTPLLQVPIQQPGRPPITPATPPSTTMPPWTPPVAPAPSQTNVPAPLFILGGPGTSGAPGYTGVPGLTIPGAFNPIVANVRGATVEFHPTLRLAEEYSDNFFQATN